MNVSPTTPAAASPSDALTRLVNREEVLQICYWFQGEGFGDRFGATLLRPFLNCDAVAIETALSELAVQGDLQSAQGAAGYGFTDKGRREAGRLFADGFADFQKQGHGECDAGCCDSDDHSRCGEKCPLH